MLVSKSHLEALGDLMLGKSMGQIGVLGLGDDIRAPNQTLDFGHTSEVIALL